MPRTDYAATPCGSLKLKGGGPPTKTTKHRKKKQRLDQPPSTTSLSLTTTNAPSADTPTPTAQALEKASGRKDSGGVAAEEEEEEKQEKGHNNSSNSDAPLAFGAGKTDAERRHDARRRKRLDERLKREGVKTHKERVEELNRYLSNLSEHHDMPRIGPG